jgi:hypothetical protein
MGLRLSTDRATADKAKRVARMFLLLDVFLEPVKRRLWHKVAGIGAMARAA